MSRVDVNGGVWMEEEVVGGAGEDAAAVKSELVALAELKPMFEEDWYLGSSADPSPAESMLLQPVDSSSSCSPSSVAFNLDPSQPFFPQNQKAAISSLFNVVCSNPCFESSAAEFELAGCDGSGFLGAAALVPDSTVLLNRGGGNGDGGILGFPGLCPCAPVVTQDLRMPLPDTGMAAGFGFGFARGFGGFESFDSCPFFNRAKILQPLEVLPPLGAQPTLFQKRAAALRQISALGGAGAMAGGSKGGSFGNLVGQTSAEGAYRGRSGVAEDMGDANIDSSGFSYDSDEGAAENANVEDNTNTSNSNSAMTACGGGGGDQKGKKKGMPAKNLMAERRRRKKLNDRLYMLRSVVPKISKVEVREREGQAVNIHMFCARRPGLLLSTMSALDNLGLDIQQAVISCFNGFALDVFRAEQCKNGPGVRAEEIKALLLHTAGCHGAI